MKKLFENVIARGGYDLGVMLKKIDSYHIEGKLTDAEKDDLYAKARAGADAQASVDVLKKLEELEARVRALEEGGGSGGSSGSGADEPEAYVPGKWYYAGARVAFEGKRYVCIAPKGMVCVWSPGEYPAYWEVLE